jgi:Leucine-rich repeat (LRR) protein
MYHKIYNCETFLEDLKNVENDENNLLKIQLDDFNNSYNIDDVVYKLLKYDKIKILLHIINLKLEKMPECIFKLKNIKELHLYANYIKTVSPSIYELKNLVDLNLGYNSFESFPESICELRQLNVLSFAHSNLRSLPDSFKNFVNLLCLDISNNKIDIFPESICELKQLVLLNLASNKISSFPKSIKNLKNLKFIDFHYNKFIIFPELLYSLYNLEKIICDGTEKIINKFEITKLQKLQIFKYMTNGIHLPIEFCDLQNIQISTYHTDKSTNCYERKRLQYIIYLLINKNFINTHK